ncbi:esterase family protein [Frankia sp. AgB32]|uniref:alpha/beta hydrolase n=1 Tax=Frankia sp. AgB32 TaxID=631119 RepID=UPI00201048E7|nr:alpha/beta hydrolase-fold protein [Frankia sp. AgB32]MCK9898365.1 esterase family protein [Frankia sp. AgB32]
MRITAWPFLVVLYVLGLLCLVAVYVAWNRWPRVAAVPGRVIGMILIMSMGAVIAMAQVNHQFGFYTSLSDLLGNPGTENSLAVPVQPRSASGVDVLTADWLAAGRHAARHGKGEMLSVIFHGAHSGLSHHGLLYLPASYFRGPVDQRFPALEVFHGFPGSPETFPGNMSIQSRLEAEIAAGRIPPMVLVIPQVYQAGISSECVNAVRGPQFETYLAIDVFDDVVAGFRVLPARSWATFGISTGGFCATNIALHHPERYAAAASLSGYFNAAEDPGTSALYLDARFGRRINSPIWWVHYHAPEAPALYLFASGGDPPAVTEAKAMTEALRRYCRALPTTTVITGQGGHNWGVWSAAFAPAVDWLAQYLPAPLTPPR